MRLRKPLASAATLMLGLAMTSLIPLGSTADASSAAAAGHGGTVVQGPAAECADLVGLTIRASQIGTPDMAREDAQVTSAELVEASDAVTTPDGTATSPGSTSSVETPAKPQFCQVTGSIAASTEGAEPIGFQVNLPTEWNGAAAQFGGGGFNGALRDATGYISFDTNAGDVVTPLMRGYATVSTDSGHLTTESPRADSTDPVERADATFDFALNDEMFRNFARDAYPKVKDVGDVVVESYYEKGADSWLWFGGSEGGREGLLMAQEFPEEFDGIVVRNPVIGWTGLFSNFINTLHAVERNDKAGAFTEADIDLLARTSSSACDADDGITDGVLSDYGGCQDEVKHAVDNLECEGGARPGTCLTAAQLRVVDAVYEDLDLGYTLPSGMDSYPGFFFGGESWSLADKVGNDPSIDYGDQGYANYLNYGAGAAKFVFAQDPDTDPLQVEPRQMKQRFSQVSRLMDTVDPDLSAFRDHGGKLIVLECTNDYAQSAAMGMRYYDSVREELGEAAVDDFFKLYVSPGTDHGCGGSIDPTALDENGVTDSGLTTSTGTRHGVPRNVDWVSLIEAWVDDAQNPGDSIVASANDPATPFAALATKPICAYPNYPRYTGGEPASASSYSCVGTNPSADPESPELPEVPESVQTDGLAAQDTSTGGAVAVATLLSSGVAFAVMIFARTRARRE